MNTFVKGYDLVARVGHTQDQGWVPYDTDLTYELYAPNGALARFIGREEELTQKDVEEVFLKDEGDVFFFARWEEPGWTML